MTQVLAGNRARNNAGIDARNNAGNGVRNKATVTIAGACACYEVRPGN